MSAVLIEHPGLARPTAKRLVVNDVSVEFGGLRALSGVSMSAEQGEVVGVIGPNGAGKTTLFNVICGFIRPDSGTITYGEAQLARHGPHDLNRLGIARTMQGVGLWDGMSVLENVMLGAQARVRSGIAAAFLGLRRSAGEESSVARAARDVLDQLGIGAYARRRPGTLPYAVQKKTALARALLAKPSMLMLDEPASGLSDDEMGQLATLIRGLAPGIGVLLVEHRMDLVNAVCDRIVVLNFGEVIADGTPAEIRADPAVATAYLGREVETAPSSSPDTAELAAPPETADSLHSARPAELAGPGAPAEPGDA